MGLFSLSNLAKIGGFAAAPFTGGASIPIGLGVGGALDAGAQQGKANEAQEEAMAAMRADLAARQPFRDQLFASLQQGQPERQDLSNVFQSQNPFAQSLGPLNPEQPQAMAPIAPGAPPAQGRGGRGFAGRVADIGRGLPDRGRDVLEEGPSRFLRRF